MPQEINCSGCGYVLYEGDLLRSPQDIIKKYEGKCPNCGKPLVVAILNIQIVNAEDTEKKKKKT